VITVRSTRLARTLRDLKSKVPLVVLGCVVVLLLWMAGSIAVQSGLLGFGYLDPKQFGIFLTFIGACLGTVATVFAALLTRAHNAREHQRLRLDSVIKSLESIPSEAPKARLAGVLSTMTLLGHHRVAIRVLKPAWDAGEVDDGTATWVIGQVLVGAKPEAARDDLDLDENAAKEAATLLFLNAAQLTDSASRISYFPQHFVTRWTTERELPAEAKLFLLLTVGRMLVTRSRSWWSPDDRLPNFPTDMLIDCVENERLRGIRSCAAVLLAALRDQLPKAAEKYFRPAELAAIADHANVARVPAEVRKFANHIRDRWDSEQGAAAEVA
jgi:hypothetical protein